MLLAAQPFSSFSNLIREDIENWRSNIAGRLLLSFSIFILVQKISFTAKTDFTELNPILDWFDHATQSCLPRAALIQCQTLLAEGFTNAVRHAHQGYAVETPIEIEVTLLERQLELRIWDYGQPFDLIQKLEKLPEQVDASASSGRGLKLIKKIADRFDYIRLEDGRNCLLVIKSY